MRKPQQPIVNCAVCACILYFGVDYAVAQDDWPMLDDWPMFGQNVRHTAQSPYPAATTADIARVIHSQSVGGLALGTTVDGTDFMIYGSMLGPGHRLAAMAPDGTLLWYVSEVGNTNGVSPAIAADGTVYLAPDSAGIVFALDPSRGTLDADRRLHNAIKWTFDTGNTSGFQQSSPTIGNEGTVYIGSQDGNVYAINGDGELAWKYKTGGAVMSSPAIGVDEVIYVGSKDGSLYALKNGALKWRFKAGGSVLTPAIGNDGTVYVTTTGLKLFAVNDRGRAKWSATLGKAPRGTTGYATCPAIDTYESTEIIYAGGPNGLSAFSTSGSLQWKYKTSQLNTYQPAIDALGTVYVTSDDGKMHAVAPGGQSLWVSDVFGPRHYWHGSPVIADDGSVLVDGAGGLIQFQSGGIGVPVIQYLTTRLVPDAPSQLELRAEWVGDDPDGWVESVLFYADTDLNGVLTEGDEFLGKAAVTDTASQFIIAPAPSEPGQYTYFAMAIDNAGNLSNVVTGTFEVQQSAD
jgi:outer membrane protein assembly factor BamB